MRIGYAHADSLLTYPDADNLSTSSQPIRVSTHSLRRSSVPWQKGPGVRVLCCLRVIAGARAPCRLRVIAGAVARWRGGIAVLLAR